MGKKDLIQVYNICSLISVNQLEELIIAEPFAAYLDRHPNLHLPHRHSFYHIVLFTKGGGHHTIDFEQYPVKARQIYFMIPGQVHSWSFKGKIDGYVINFSNSLFHSFIANSQYLEQFSFLRGTAQDGVIDLSPGLFNVAVSIVKKLVDEVHRKEAFTVDMIRSLLLQLFVTIAREHSATPLLEVPQQNSLVLYNFRKLIEQHYMEKRLPKEYAAMLYITPNHLNALCKDLLGKPAGEVIRDRILLEVKRLLVNADLSISEIAYRLNFSDNSHLTKFFKKYTHVAPEEFRRSSLGGV